MREYVTIVFRDLSLEEVEEKLSGLPIASLVCACVGYDVLAELEDCKKEFKVFKKELSELMADRDEARLLVESYVALLTKMLDMPNNQEKFKNICKSLKLDN